MHLINNVKFFKQVWDIRTQKLKQDLPGHADEVSLVNAFLDLQTFFLCLISCNCMRSMKETFPGIQVFAVDWSPDGEKVASGGKDKVLKLWMG